MRAFAVLGLSLLAACASPPGTQPPSPAAASRMVEFNNLRAHWFPADLTSVSGGPAVVALHGCGGLYDRQGRLAARYVETAARLNAQGIGVLFPDSFGSRGLGSQCVARPGVRAVTVETRSEDLRQALAWLAATPGVDGARVGLQAWSNGGTTALRALERMQDQPTQWVPLAGAALFYPRCTDALRRDAVLARAVPLLMQLGALDDWTAPQPCEALARAQARQPRAQTIVHVYPDSYHGFDGTEAVRLRTDIRGGVNPAGVHQGGNPEARAQALARLDAFWASTLRTTRP